MLIERDLSESAQIAFRAVLRRYHHGPARIGLEREDVRAHLAVSLWEASAKTDSVRLLTTIGSRAIADLWREFGAVSRKGVPRLATTGLDLALDGDLQERQACGAEVDWRTPESEFWRQERGERVRHHLARLRPSEQEVLRLRFWEDLTPDEIAERSGRRWGTVHRLLYTGRKRLRELLAEDLG